MSSEKEMYVIPQETFNDTLRKAMLFNSEKNIFLLEEELKVDEKEKEEEKQEDSSDGRRIKTNFLVDLTRGEKQQIKRELSPDPKGDSDGGGVEIGSILEGGMNEN